MLIRVRIPIVNYLSVGDLRKGMGATSTGGLNVLSLKKMIGLST